MRACRGDVRAFVFLRGRRGEWRKSCGKYGVDLVHAFLRLDAG
jgi:hypothetical protein